MEISERIGEAKAKNLELFKANTGTVWASSRAPYLRVFPHGKKLAESVVAFFMLDHDLLADQDITGSNVDHAISVCIEHALFTFPELVGPRTSDLYMLWRKFVVDAWTHDHPSSKFPSAGF